ncbi:MAG: hypothetical protein KGL53_13305, partial [Elusimicrobia bacterium]|nr:hypothetical protein [Elusimicrobiota bacterium]
MPTDAGRRAADLLALALLVLMAAALFTRLAAFPGLHGDEAWVGLFADRLRARGLYTPHEMNTYTGALYGWLVAKVFAWRGAGVGTLRLPGAVLNVAAWLVFWRLARRAAGAWGGLAWCALAASSALVVLHSRVAWEVYALQPLLAALALTGAVRRLERGGRAAALLLFYASLLGAQNHFIFLSLPAALVLAAGAVCARRREAAWLDLLTVSLANMLPCVLLFLAKPLIREAAWPAVEGPALAAFWLSPLAALAALEAAPRWAPRL